MKGIMLQQDEINTIPQLHCWFKCSAL